MGSRATCVAGLAGGGGLNIGFEAVDRHACGPLRDHIALRFVARAGPAVDLSYAELARQTNRFANVLQGLGAGKSDRLFVLAGRIPELSRTDIVAPCISRSCARCCSSRKRWLTR